jgi:hypothetical protein
MHNLIYRAVLKNTVLQIYLNISSFKQSCIYVFFDFVLINLSSLTKIHKFAHVFSTPTLITSRRSPTLTASNIFGVIQGSMTSQPPRLTPRIFPSSQPKKKGDMKMGEIQGPIYSQPPRLTPRILPSLQPKQKRDMPMREVQGSMTTDQPSQPPRLNPRTFPSAQPKQKGDMPMREIQGSMTSQPPRLTPWIFPIFTT